MEFAFPLDQMTTAEKLQALEQIWDALSRKPDEVPSPAWHADILAEREKSSGQFIDWSEAKRQIRDATR